MNPAALPIVKAVLEMANRFLKETKGRRTRAALLSATSAINRAIKLYPKIKEDKNFMKYKRKFDRNKIRK